MYKNLHPIGTKLLLFEKTNENLQTTKLLGVSKYKKVIPSKANIRGTDLSKYQLVEEDCFICKLMSIGRDKMLAVGLYQGTELAITSPAYYVFKTKKELLDSKYLMLLFQNPKIDAELYFTSCGGIRGELSWEDFCKLEIPIPDIKKQRQIIRDYETLNRA